LAIWKARNKTCFEDKLLSDPKDIIYHARVFRKYWADLLSGLSKEDLMRGVEGLLQTVAAVDRQHHQSNDPITRQVLMLQY
jgi:hypothetical protein